MRAFRSLLKAHARITDEIRAHLDTQHGLTLSEFDMIAELGNQPGMRMGDLAVRLITSPANATRVAQSLETKGFVVRQRATHSDREVLAALTPAGQAFFTANFRGTVTFMAGLFDRSLSHAEEERLADLLGRLAKPEA